MSTLACVFAVLSIGACDHQQDTRPLLLGAKPQPASQRSFALTGPVHSIWQGLYAGGSIGYGAGTSVQSYDRNNNHGLATVYPDGFIANATVGYNYLATRHVLTGVEADLGFMDLSSGLHTVYDGHQWNGKFGSLWGTARGRVGYVSGDWLFFGTGGLAFMQTDNISIGNTPTETAIDDSLRTGWTLGAGVEVAVTDRLTAKLEYLHLGFGKYSGRSGNNEAFYFKDSVNIVRVGVNYHF